MNGTIVDIQGISVSVNPIPMQDSTDMAYILTIGDGTKEINIQIAFGKIINSTIR
jgi:hypothetical protein